MITKNSELQQLASKIEIEGRSQTDNGNWIIYFNEFEDPEYEFLIENQFEIAKILRSRESVSEVQHYVKDEYFDIIFYLDYCPNVPEEEFENLGGN